MTIRAKSNKVGIIMGFFNCFEVSYRQFMMYMQFIFLATLLAKPFSFSGKSSADGFPFFPIVNSNSTSPPWMIKSRTIYGSPGGLTFFATQYYFGKNVNGVTITMTP